MVRKRIIVSGQVQGVFFRDTCRRLANRHGVTGWVRNRPDGTVEAVFEGAPEQVAQLVTWAREGPDGALVSGVDVQDEPAAGLSTFEITN